VSDTVPHVFQGGYCSRMASKSTKLDHLQRVSLFEGCSRKELQSIARAGDEITMTAGTIVVDQGQMGREAFVVLDGQVTVKRNGRKITTLGAGAVVGELSLLDHGPRTATVSCDTDCTLYVIDQRHFRGVIEHSPSIAMKLLATLAGHIRTFDRQYYG
jgi:CRP/FNR family cyclic AMP-dependent transcriptional regulator